jgi:UDP-N-acetyl-D-galactosamine dehydrogenase
MVAAVAHREFAAMGLQQLAEKVVPGGVFADVKSVYEAGAVRALGLNGWRL